MIHSNLKGDVTGALSAAFFTIPLSIGYGLLAFAPLGTDFLPIAALLGIYAGIFAGFFAPLFGGTKIQVTCPEAAMTLILASFVATVAANPQIAPGPSRNVIIVGLAALCVMTGGLIQLIFGALRLGDIVKYVPYPLISGFMNGIALLLILKQVRPLLGITATLPLREVAGNFSLVQPLTLLVGAITLAALYLSRRFIKVVPAPLTGIAAGTAVYYALGAVTQASALGPVIGSVQFRLPTPAVLPSLLQHAADIDMLSLLPHVVITGLVLSLVGSTESLLSSLVSDNMTGTRHDSNRELIGQGIGNIANSLFGALPATGSMTRSVTNYRAGGRTRLSGMMCGISILIVIATLGGIIGKIPVVVFAGIFVAIGISLFDSWSVDMLKNLPRTQGDRKNVVLNHLVAFTVAAVTVVVNPVVAVGIGMVISTALFVARMGKSIVKRTYLGDRVRSNKVRPLAHDEVLNNEGRQIVVYELQGPLFFGSAENLVRRIEGKMDRATYCVLDMKRVTEVDSTGARILCQLGENMEKSGKQVLISYLKGNRSICVFLEAMGLFTALSEDRFFPDTDRALEWAEDHLLGIHGLTSEDTAGVELEQNDVLKNFSAREFAVLKETLVRKTYRKGEPLISEGDAERNLFFLTRGSVSVKARLSESDRHARLVTYSSGVIIGEMAFLDGSPRSADVWSESDSEAYLLSPGAFAGMSGEHPEIALKLLRNIAIEVSRRLRSTSDEVRALEEW